MNEIRVKTFRGVDYRNGLDLSVLNEERRKLIGAKKISIYVHDDMYLATKWTRPIHLDLIELRRYDSLEWQELSFRSIYFKHYQHFEKHC